MSQSAELLLQAGGGLRQGRFPQLRRMGGFGGGEEATSSPREGPGRNPGEATADHLERIKKTPAHKNKMNLFMPRQSVSHDD